MHANKNVNGPCTAVYTPPAHKAIVVTSVVYNYGSGIEGNENFGGLFSGPCTAGTLVDQIDQVDKFGSGPAHVAYRPADGRRVRK